MVNLNRRIALNTFSGVVKIAINAAILIFLIPFIIRSVGVEQFGLWTLVMSTLSFFDLMDLGLSNAVIKYITDARAKGDESESNKILSTLFFSYIFLAGLAFISLVILALIFNFIFSIPHDNYLEAIALLLILGLRPVLFTLPLSLFKGVLFAEQYIYFINIVSLTTTALYAIFAWLVLSSGFGLIALALCSLASIAIEYFAYFILFMILEKKISISYADSSFKTLRKIIPFSSAQFMSQIGSLVLFNTDIVIIKFFLNLTDVAIYAIPLRIMTFCFMLLSQFTFTLTPLIVRIYAKQEHENLKKVFVMGTKYAFIPATFMAVPGIIFSKEILSLWVGSNFIAGSSILIILLISMWLTRFHSIGGDILQLCGYHHRAFIYTYVSVLVHIIMSIILIIPFKLVGVALGTLIASLIALFLELRKALEITHLSFFQYLRSIYLIVIIPACIQAVAIFILKSMFAVNSLAALVLINVPPVLLSISSLWLLISHEEKELIKSAIFSKRNFDQIG